MGAEDSARACTAQIQTRVAGEVNFEGTGFFVGRGLLLTCAHVVSDRRDANLVAVWAGKTWPCQLAAVLPDPFPKDARLGDGMPDLALLRCGAGNREALLLDRETPVADEAHYLFYGFSEEADGEIVGHPLRCRLDGRIDVQPDWRLLQFSTGRVLKGMSGCAILWEQNGRVVAIAKRRLGGDFTACYGIPADTVLSRLEVVETEQRAIKLEVAERESRQRLVPLPGPNTFFFPRKPESSQLAETLRKRKIAALLGPEGIGKSALAREYVLDTLADYQEALWLDTQSMAEARQSLFAIAQRLEIALKGTPPSASREPYEWFATAAQQIYAWLENGLDPHKERWLLVLDGIQDIRLGQTLLPQSEIAKVLITSRLDDMRALQVREPVRLGPLPATDARELVSVRLGPAAERVPADAIAAQSEGMPAQLERGAAMALEVGLSTGSYPDTAPDTDVYLTGVLAEPAPGSLLRLLSVLAEAPLPFTVLFQPGSDISVRSVQVLTSASLALLDPASDWLETAKELREIVRQRLSPSELERWQTKARDLLLRAFDREAHLGALAKLSISLLPHALYLLETWVAKEAVAEDVLLRTYTARALSVTGDNVSAEQLLDASHDLVARDGAARFGIKAIAEYLLRLASLKMELRGPEAAEVILDDAERQLRSHEPLEGEGPGDFAEFVLQECTDLRGSIRAAQGRFEEAVKLFEQALTYFANHERGALRAAYTLQKLMDSLMRWGRVAHALLLLPRVAEALGKTPSASEAEARAWLYLGKAYMQTAGNEYPGKMVQLMNASRYLERALTVAENAPSENDEVIASCCVNLAIVLRRSKEFGRGDDAKAKSYLERAINIRRKRFGPASPYLKIAYYHLGMLQVETGEFDYAEANLLAVRAMPAEPGDNIRRNALAELVKVYDRRHDEGRMRQMQRELEAADRESAKLPGRLPHPGESSQERNAALFLATHEIERQVSEANTGSASDVEHEVTAGDLRAALEAGRLTADRVVRGLRPVLKAPQHLLALIDVIEPRTPELSPEMRGEVAVLHSVGLVEIGNYPQALEVANHALADENLPDDRRAELYNAKGRALFHLGNYNNAAEAYKAGIAVCEPNSPFVAQLLINLGNAILADVNNPKRDLAAAKAALERAIPLANDSRLRVEARSSLSTALINGGDLIRARSLLDEAWIMAQSDPQVADKARMIVLRNLGVVQFLQRDFPAGKRSFEAAIERGTAHFGVCHPEMIELHRYILGFYGAAMAPQQAVGKALRALQTAQRECGVAHPAVQAYTQIALNVATVAAQRIGRRGRISQFRRLLQRAQQRVLDNVTLAAAVKMMTR
jgi:tetratricopeptide (TPR) repeat protein